MDQNVKVIGNSPVVFLLCGLCIAFVIFQAVVFMRKAWKRGKQIGMSAEAMKKTMVSSCLFSIVPSIPILLVLALLMPNLGMYFPWLRLSVVGSGAYETMASNATAKAFGLAGISDPNFTDGMLVAAMWVMTIGIIWGPLYTVIGSKYISKGMDLLKGKQEKRFSAIFSSMFIAMVCVFSGPYLASPFKMGTTGIKGIIPLLVFIVGAVVYYLIEKIGAKTGARIMKELSFPVSMILGMVSAILFNMVL